MSFLTRAYRTILKQPLLLILPIAMMLIADLIALPSIGGMLGVLVATGLSGRSPLVALGYMVIGLLVSGATISGYNAMVGGVTAGKPASLAVFSTNLTKHITAILTALVVASVLVAVIGLILPSSAWGWLSVVYAIGGAFAHVWLAAVVLEGKGAFPAVQAAIRSLAAKAHIYIVVLGAAIALDYVVPELIDYLRFGAYQGTWPQVVGLLSTIIGMSIGVLMRVAVFDVYTRPEEAAPDMAA